MPPVLLLCATLVATMSIVPIIYLTLRTISLGPRLAEVIPQLNVAGILFKTVALTAAVTLSAVLIGTTLGWLTAQTDLPGRRVWRVATCLPLVLPSYVSAYALIVVLGPRGLLQHALGPVGIERLPSIYGFPGAWLALTLFTYPFVMLSVRAGLRGLDPSLIDASRSLGRSPRQVFCEVILPQLRPSIRAGALLSALYTLSDFGAVSLMQFNAFTRAIYIHYTASLDTPTASLLALMLVGLTLVILVLEFRAEGSARYYRSGAGSKRPAPRVPLGLWRWPSFAFCGLVTLVGIGLPILAILVWLWHGLQAGEPLAPHRTALWHSVIASTAGAVCTACAAMPVVWLSVRYAGKRTRFLERAAYVGHALPGIVIALSLVFIGARFLLPLYQTLAMLVAAYMIRFLPLAIGTMRSSLLQVNPRLEEAARNLGRSPREVFRTIVLPLARPGILAGSALIFLSCMKELPATLLLGPTGFHTLATRIWSATEEAFFARAAIPALMLVGVSAISLWILLANEEKGISA
jgi:iron(III) transport system permease protein